MASVVVVGAGLAGLACALQLQKAGHDVEVLEGGDALGGRLQGRRRGEFLLDAEPGFLLQGDTHLVRLVAELGLEERRQPIAGPLFAVLREGRFEPLETEELRGLLRSAPLSVRSRAHLPWLVLELFRRRRWDPLCPERAASEDETDGAAWLRRAGGGEAFDFLVAPLLCAAFQLDPETLSPVFAAMALHQLLGGLGLDCLEGGFGAVVRALGDRVPARVGWAVSRVEPDELGVSLDFVTPSGERRLRAEVAVIAVPAGQAAVICPRLTPAERSFLAAVPYRRGMSVHLLLAERGQPPPAYVLAFPPSAGLGLASVSVEHRKPGAAPREAGLLRVRLCDAVVGRLWRAPDPEVIAFVQDALARTPLGRVVPEDAVVARHDPFLPGLATGRVRALDAFRRRSDPTPRLAFAGDYLVGSGAEAAVASGLRAAQEVEAIVS